MVCHPAYGRYGVVRHACDTIYLAVKTRTAPETAKLQNPRQINQHTAKFKTPDRLYNSFFMVVLYYF